MINWLESLWKLKIAIGNQVTNWPFSQHNRSSQGHVVHSLFEGIWHENCKKVRRNAGERSFPRWSQKLEFLILHFRFDSLKTVLKPWYRHEVIFKKLEMLAKAFPFSRGCHFHSPETSRWNSNVLPAIIQLESSKINKMLHEFKADCIQ